MSVQRNNPINPLLITNPYDIPDIWFLPVFSQHGFPIYLIFLNDL